MHQRYNSSMDSEGLQTDVMRFLAIIALCLVAILALVQRAQPPEVAVSATLPSTRPETGVTPVVEPTQKLAPTPTPTPTPSPTTTPTAIAVPVVAASPPIVAEDLFVVQQPEPRAEKIATVAPIKEPDVDLAIVTEPMNQTADKPLAPAPAAVPAPQPQTQLASELPSTTQAGSTQSDSDSAAALSLRFASERDFLRLLTDRTVTLYLFNSDSALRLGNDFAFAASPSPNQVYEVLPSTIPAAILRSAEQGVLGLQDYAWGVGMPPAIDASIKRWVQRVDTGELLIDRYGEVTHVEVSRADG